MADAITTDDISTLFPGTELTTAEIARAALYIDFAEGEIESWLGKPLELTSFTETIYPEASGAVYFKNRPVVSLESFTVNGDTNLDATSITVVAYGLENIWDLTWAGVAADIYTVWTDGVYGGEVTVTYTAGLDYPEAVRSLVAGAVIKRLMSDRALALRDASSGQGVKSLRVEDYEIAFENTNNAVGSGILMFPNPEMDFKSIRRLKRIGII